ncbi:MAG: LysR family hydrogen peroxide-inducible transcriptional activator [Myxococcota bacterium]|jgi:LysR family hydrogen peroxide-inducible transcriptional activator
MNLPTLRQLEYIVAVADQRHFGRAAEHCGVTQPGLSAQVRELESLLDVTIFERDPKGVLLTTAGGLIVERAREILIKSAELVDAAHGAHRPLWGRLDVGVIPTVAPYLLPRALPRVRRKHRELNLRLRELQTDRLVEELEQGRLDLLIVALDVDLGAAETLPLFDDPFYAVMTKGHDLAKKKTIADADLKGQQVLLLEDGHCLRGHALSVCQAHGASELADLFRATSLNTLMQMITEDDVMTLLPELAVASETRGRRDLVVRPLRSPAPFRRIGLAWRKGSPRADEFRLLAECFER